MTGLISSGAAFANPTERTKLLGDSSKDAKAQGRKKKTGKDSKDVAFGPVTKYIFDRDQTDGEREWQAKYQANTSDFVRSTIQFWGRLKTEYSNHAKSLKETGGGLKEGEAYTNQIAKICNEFPLWDELHPMLNKIPSIVPPGISNSEHGQDHSGVASSLFASGKSSTKENSLNALW
ncbi:hypothetical protein C8F01DRAFT_1237994 [Mycena amicta]|nr:hypothetical protein C8F01DRAFT_1237994 [Mycena amicta]